MADIIIAREKAEPHDLRVVGNPEIIHTVKSRFAADLAAWRRLCSVESAISRRDSLFHSGLSQGGKATEEGSPRRPPTVRLAG
jgi:hypothetical protein